MRLCFFVVLVLVPVMQCLVPSMDVHVPSMEESRGHGHASFVYPLVGEMCDDRGPHWLPREVWLHMLPTGAEELWYKSYLD
eukprot:gene7339-biopygen14118